MKSQKQVHEFTLRAVLGGVLMTVLFTASNVYMGLKIGFTFATSIPAAVISMSLLKFFRNNSILENNIVQTIASAAGALSAIIYVIPAMIIIGYWEMFQVMHTTVLCAVGGILGVMFTIPLRRAMVVESDLKYPEGFAAAEVLKVGNSEVDEAGYVIADKKGGAVGGQDIMIAGLLSGFFAFLQGGLKLIGTEISCFLKIGGAVVGLGTGFSLALIGAGYIIGFHVGLSMLIGTLFSWVGALGFLSMSIPISPGETLKDAAYAIWSEDIRFIGVGAMTVAAIWALLSLMKPLVQGVQAAFKTLKDRQRGKKISRLDHDMPINLVIVFSLFLIVPIYFLFNDFLNVLAFDFGFYGWLALIIFCVFFAFFFSFLISSACGYMAGLVGSSNSPLSGIAIIAVLAASLILYGIVNVFDDGEWTPRITQNAMALVMFVTTFILAVGSVANDNLQDLKTGQLVNATPYKQQMALVVGVLAGAVIIPYVLNLLYQAYGFTNALPRAGMDISQALPVPQANLMASLTQGIFSKSLNWPMFKIGVVIAVLNIIFNELMRFKGSKFKVPVLGTAMGIYLPYEMTVVIFIGSMLSVFVHRKLKHSDDQSEGEKVMDPNERRGLLLASGLIVGESLMGVFMAIVIVTTGLNHPFALHLPFVWHADLFGAACFAAILIFAYRYIVKKI